jgi:hypothetical protein
MADEAEGAIPAERLALDAGAIWRISRLVRVARDG